MLLCGHRPGVELLQLPVQLVQLAVRGPQLTLHVSRTLAAGDGPPQPLCRLLDLQLPLDLLPEQSTSILQTLLKLRVQNIPLLQTLEVTALKNTQQLQSLIFVPLNSGG